jgi:hypothetical protein
MLQRRSASALTAAAAAVLALGSVAVASGREFTPTPVPPIHVHLPKPQEVAVFDAIVEGEAHDELESQLSGESATCLYQENGTVTETTTYRRGKGVRLEFDRYGKEVLVHRAGRETDSSLAVQLATTRTASGGSSASPSHPPLPCTVPPYDLAENPDCGKAFPGDGAASFEWEGGLLGLTISERKSRPGEENDTCGIDPQTGLPQEFREAWPTPPKLQSSQLPLGRIFGHRKAFKVEFRVSDVPRGPHASKPREVSGGNLRGTVVETATNKATVRFIRVSGGK